MCGISGFASVHKIKNEHWISLARDELFHRGPDSSGSWISPDSKVVLHHRRLSIIDLNQKSNQPMISDNSNYSIVFNGEIYNYKELRSLLLTYGKRFKTNSDTEVLLQAYKYWGEDCVKFLNGMFSFAIYDYVKNVVFFARDRAGEKPFFYQYTQDQILFGSELKALLKKPQIKKKINYEALDCYLSMGYIPKNLCILDGFNKLPPGHLMTFNLHSGELKLKKYWDLPDFENQNDISEDNLLDELEYLLEDSVKKQLSSDVPLGILLSGGIDSSLITAFASRSIKKIKTFTIRNPENKDLDETQHARLIANHFATDHIELDAEQPDVDLLLKLARTFDEPMADSSMIPMYLVSRLIKKYCTVALGGDGGDELFGGYGHYSRLLWMKKYLDPIPMFMRKGIANSACNILPIGFKGRNWLTALKIDLKYGLPLIATFFDPITRHKLVPKLREVIRTSEDIFFANLPYNNDLLQRATRMDFLNYLPEDILVKVDRSSMANSLEIRAPMLDYRLIEFSFSKVPSCLKATTSNKKILLKKLTEKILPKQFDRNRKQGFSIPLNQWLVEGKSRDFFNDVLTSSVCMFDKKTVKDLLIGLDSGRSNGERLFSLVMLELWKNEYGISL